MPSTGQASSENKIKKNLRSKPATETAPKNNWRKEIATNRGSSWHRNMLKGRRDALLNPSLMRLARLSKNVHQLEMAKALDLSESTLGSIERGLRKVKTPTVQAIAKYLGMPPERLFRAVTRKNPRRPENTKFLAIIQKSSI